MTTPPTLEASQINYVDLDLDVAVRPDGCIELLDQDEFDLHRLKYGYPADVIQQAERAAGQVAEMARRGSFPFSEG